ncbi:MAG: hypothetical protein JXB42_12455, partial [Deltaproteobacteria bacterium]|nr:hypothetical protein [Deltaproteobacteria bacterium]
THDRVTVIMPVAIRPHTNKRTLTERLTIRIKLLNRDETKHINDRLEAYLLFFSFCPIFHAYTALFPTFQ